MTSVAWLVDNDNESVVCMHCADVGRQSVGMPFC